MRVCIRGKKNVNCPFLKVVRKGLEILIAVVFCKECVLQRCNDGFCSARGGRMGGELTEGVGEQNPALHDQNSSSNPA